MSSHKNDNKDLSKTEDIKTINISAIKTNITDALDNMEIQPLYNIIVPAEKIEIFDHSGISMEHKSIYDILEEYYTSTYLYESPVKAEIDSDCDMVDFAYMEIGEIIEPWESIQDMADNFGYL